MSTIVIAAEFTKSSGQPATGLSLGDIALHLIRLHNTTGVDSVVWDGSQNPTIEVDNCGAYARLYTDADLDTYTYFAMAQYTGAEVLDVDYAVGSAGGTAADVWGYATRTLTQSRASLSDSSVSGRIVKTRGDTWIIPLTGLGSLTGYTTIDFMIKDDTDDDDTDAVAWVRKNSSGVGDGLLYLNKASIASPVIATDASIAIDDLAAGNITITVHPRVTKDISPKGRYYDTQTVIGTAVNTPEHGTFVTTADVTRATS